MAKSAVDAIIAEAMDACALDQVAKLNTMHLSSDSSLPSDLESRFRKLKSLPARTKPTASPAAITSTRSLNLGEGTAPAPAPAPAPPPPSEPILGSTFNGGDNKVPASSSPVKARAEKEMSTEGHRGIELGTGFQAGQEEKFKKSSSPDTELGSGFSPIKRRDLSPGKSADRVGCCFFLSPKRTTSSTTPRSRGKGGSGRVFRDMDFGEEDELQLSEIFASLKDEKKKLKKALEEQEKVRKEAAKLVRMSKEASDRMRADTDELFSDLDEDELGGTHFH